MSCVHLTAMWNDAKGAFSGSVSSLNQRAARVLGCLYYLSSDFMSLNNKLLAQPCHWGLSHFVCQCVHVLFSKSHLCQPIVWSFKVKFANSIIMLEITKEGANGCSCYCKPDFHRLSRAWHIRGKFIKRGPAAAAVAEQLDFCCQPRMEAGPWKLLTVSCNALSGLGPSGSLKCYSFPELNGGCCYTGGQYKIRLQVNTEEALGGDTLWFAL